MEIPDRKPRKKPTKIEEMTKEQVRQAIYKKRECNAKALQIVNSLLDPSVIEPYFLQCLPHINRAHFDDIIEERSITHLCGYPLCPKTLSPKDIPQQKYRISLKTNKVYDITTRKNFCSNNCYSSAMYVRKQMLTSPLWFREYEDIPQFSLLQLNTVGSMGEEVDVTLIERVMIADKKPFTSINDFAEASLNEISPGQAEEAVNDETEKPKEDLKQKVNLPNISETKQEKAQPDETTKESKSPSQSTSDNTHKPQKSNPFNIVGDIIEKPERKIDPILTTPIQNNEKEKKAIKKTPQKKPPSVTALTIEVEKCLAEWFTLDTLLFIFGEEVVGEMVADKGECIKEYLNNYYTTGILYNSNAYDQYQALCKKLNMLELEDRKTKYDSKVKKETKPLPDYRMLKEESQKMELKVKAFFSGQTEVPEPVLEDLTQPQEESIEENVTNLPLVDKNSQNALRRRIVCQHLNKVLPDLLRSLGFISLPISSDVRLLVNTFKLKPDNIMFKPIQWTLIALIFIKLLSLRDGRLDHMMEQSVCYKHMQLILLSFQQDGGYLSRVIYWLTDIDRLLNTNDKQFTIE